MGPPALIGWGTANGCRTQTGGRRRRASSGAFRLGLSYASVGRMTLHVDHPLVRTAACAAHEANRAWCRAHGDTSQPHWGNAPLWQRDSAVRGVQAILADPDTTPEQSHEGWMAQKRKDGWVYGKVKDPTAKTHPCLVPYDALPPVQRAKDSIFGAVVRAILFAENPNAA